MVRIVGTGARAPTDVGHQDHERPRARADNPDKVERGPGIRSWRHRGLAVFPARPAIGPRAPRDALGALGPWRFKHFSARRRRRSPRDLWGYLSSRPPPGKGGGRDARGRSPGQSGRRRRASAPVLSLRDCRARVPRWASAIWRLSTRPMPEPPGLVVKKGTKRFLVSATPGPSSVITISTWRAWRRQVTSTWPPVSVAASTALRSRLISSWSS